MVSHHWIIVRRKKKKKKDLTNTAKLTHFQAVEGKRVLPDKVIIRTGVIVFDAEADQC